MSREPYYQDDYVTLYHGDCIAIMRHLPDDSVDSIVTDPPYGLGFMGKAWDALPPGEEWARECLRVLKPGGHLLAFGGSRTWHRLAVAIEDAGFEMRDSIAWLYGSGFPKHRAALKPAFEPIVLARKPFKGSLTANEAAHGTGALNIDATRIATTDSLTGGTSPGATHAGWKRPWMDDPKAVASWAAEKAERQAKAGELGRWPANVVLEECQAAALGGPKKKFFASFGSDFECCAGGQHKYIPKAPQSERPVVDGVSHPTVKPLALMRWLVKLVTPTGGVVLDPFEGSGTTLEACLLEGFRHIGIERETDYLPLIQTRIDRCAEDAA